MIEGVPDRFVGDRYHIVRELGRGGMGVVYLGRDRHLDMDVAIKFHGTTSSDATLWLKREFRAVAPLRHPNLVELYELVAHDRACYFTMEYLAGVDPRRWVARAPLTAIGSGTPAVDPQRVRDVVSQLAEGLAYLHARGVIHRDVKPSNAIVVDGVVKLLDFGLAHAPRPETDATTPARDTHRVGTVAYLAPEYLQGLVVGPALDIYALGIVAFELVTGALPFGGTLQFLGPSHGTAPRVRTRQPDVPADLDDAIAAMLVTDPDQRPTASAVVERLTGTRSRPGPNPERRRIARFVGRAAELAAIAARIGDPTPRARLVLVTGTSGVGKTALLDEAAARTRSDDTVVWRGRCHERERVPFRAFDLIIDDLATELADAPSVARVVPHLGALARVFPSLAPLLDPLIAATEEPATDLRVERERALLALAQLLRHLVADTAGVVLAIDDLQWADDDSLELLAVIVEHVDRPLTVIASWTLDDQPPSPALAALHDRLAGFASRIDVPVMAEAELVELIGGLAPGAPSAQLLDAARLAAGSPYLAEMIGRELEQSDLAGIADRVPGDPAHAELRRLARLTTVERTVAEIASLAGGTASFEQLKTLAEMSSVTLQSALRGLEQGRVVRATPSPTGVPVYVFYHQRLRDVARAAIAAPVRRGLHARYAEWIERAAGTPDQIEYHWREAGDLTRAARWAIAAAAAAQTQLAWATAADGYARALELGAPDPRTAREARADCLFLGGRLAEAARAFEALARACHDGDRWRVRAAEAYLKLGELERGLAVIDDVLARRGERRAAHRSIAVIRAALVGARWLAPMPWRAQPDEILTAAYRVIASFLSTPYPIEALEYVLRGIALAERTGDLAGHSMGLAMLGAYLATGTLGRFGDRALAHAERLARQSGAPYPRMVTAGCAGILATLRGDWTGMRHAHQQGEQICRRLGLERSWEASFFALYRALGEHLAGDPIRALELLADFRDRGDDMFSRAMLGSARGRALLLAGDLPGARRALAALRDGPAVHHGMPAVYRQLFAAELALAEHDWTRAGVLADELTRFARVEWLSLIPAVGAMLDVIIATAAIGRARSGDRAAADLALATAKRLHRRGRASFYAVTALRLWSQAETLRGNPERARVILGRAAAGASRASAVDRLAIDALGGKPIEPGPLAAALVWSTGGAVPG